MGLKMRTLFRRPRGLFVPRGQPLDQFFAKLNASRCRYVVLRWFETFPQIEKGDDIDFLVHDEDVDLLQQFLVSPLFPADAVPCDIKSISGPRRHYKGAPYFPPNLASKIIERSQMHSSGARVPCPEDHFYSLAFHALYHKGLSAGIPASSHPGFVSSSISRHDCAGRLQELSVELGINVNIEMEALDEELSRRGWKPPFDFIEKVSGKNPWARARVELALARIPEIKGLAFFLVGERAADDPENVEKICTLLREEGFDILAVKHLTAEERERAAQGVRGATWGRGPWPLSGGLPAAAVAAVDVFPKTPKRRLLRRHPAADNARIFAAKWRIRKWWNENCHPSEKCNVIHSSDNCRQACAHLHLVMPGLKERVCSEAKRLMEEVDLGGDVVASLTQTGRRASVELLRWGDGSLAVRKTFRAGKREYLDQEVKTIEALHKICPDTVPVILEKGSNYFVTPYYRASGRARLAKNLAAPLPLPALRKSFAAAKKFYEHGYVLSDFSPDNLVIQGKNEVKIIDYEHACDCQANGFTRTYTFSQFMHGDINDHLLKLPRGRVFDKKNYSRYWIAHTALSLHSVMHDPTWLAYLKRWLAGYFIIGWKGFERELENLRKRYRAERPDGRTRAWKL